MKRDISVILCTYNRSKSLRQTLNSFRKMDIPADLDWELIVVDNNSGDGTREAVLDSMASSGLNVRYIFESCQGLSHARNAGIRVAKGNIIAFTDDDVILDERWLIELIDAFVNYDADCVGGKVLPFWLDERPSWLSDNRLWGVLSLLDYGDKVFEIKADPSSYGNLLIGANIAFKRDIFVRSGLFKPELGRKGMALTGGEDQEIFQRILNQGGKAIYQPRAIVYHKVGPDRLKKSYFRKWHYGIGKSFAYMDYTYCKTIIFGIPRYMIRQFIQNLYRFLFSVIFTRKESFYYQLKLISYLSLFINKAVLNIKRGHQRVRKKSETH